MAKRKPPTPATPVADAGAAVIEKYELADENDGLPVAAHAAAVETPAEVPAELVPEKPKHPAWVLRKAKQSGLQEDEINSMSTDDLKDSLLVLAEEKRVIQDRPRNDSGQFVKPEPVPEAPFSMKDLGIEPNEFMDESTTNILTKVLAPLHAEIKKLKAEVGEVRQRETHRDANAAFDRMDQLFTENESVYGKGTRHKLGKNTPEKDRRDAVIKLMLSIPPEQRQTIEDDFERISNSLFGTLSKTTGSPASTPKPAEPIVDHETEIVNRFRNGSTIQPTSRQTAPPPKGDQSAKDFVRKWRKENLEAAIGSNSDADDEASLD